MPRYVAGYHVGAHGHPRVLTGLPRAFVELPPGARAKVKYCCPIGVVLDAFGTIPFRCVLLSRLLPDTAVGPGLPRQTNKRKYMQEIYLDYVSASGSCDDLIHLPTFLSRCMLMVIVY